MRHQTGGRAPIIKNISVIDAQGNVYEATWPKRARGLVKNGRARFVNETTICLACPPDITEGEFMNVKDILNQTSQKEAVQETAAAGTDAEPDMSYIIRKIDQIMDDSRYIRDALGQLEHAEGDTAMAISNVVENRERTNQCMIALLQKMLEATKPQTKDTGVTKLEIIQNLLSSSDMDDEYKCEILTQVIQRIL